MLKIIALAAALLLLQINLRAQEEKYSTPINWQRYKVADKDVSVLLPKMPVVVASSNACEETDSKLFAVYAEETVYQLSIYSKANAKIPEFCDVKTTFGRQTLAAVTARFNTDIQEVSRAKLNDKETIKFTAKMTTYWIIDDLANNKFVVLSVTNRSGVKPDAEKFIQSIDFKKETSGIEIKKGANRTLGDEAAENKKQEISDKEESALAIVVKPRANYTDAARKNNIRGSVNLRVTFLPHGGIGSIEPVSGLPYGLTEEAIAAARKLVFLPQKRAGEKTAVVKMVQYSFSIY